MAEPPKKKGALAALLSFGGKSTDPPEEGDGSRYSKGIDLEEDDESELDAESTAFDALAGALNIPSEKRAAAKEALSRFVKACYAKSESKETTEEE